MTGQWRDGGDDRFWLTGAANYLFRTKGVRWAVDPVFKHPAVIDAITASGARELDGLSFVLYSHDHRDHVHPPTIRALAGLPAKWVVPHFMRDKIVASGALDDRLLLVRPGDAVEIDGVRVRAFEGRHFDVGTRKGVESLWYVVEAGDRRLFLPGDVRDYDTAGLPDLGKVDDMFAHVWLGRKNALNPSPEPIVSQFAAFINHAAPSRVFLTHLYELGRNAEDMWTYTHAGRVMDALCAMSPGIRVVIPALGAVEQLS
jgi:phosphoribosyl 1,2-cyclic phosphodiesterase